MGNALDQLSATMRRQYEAAVSSPAQQQQAAAQLQGAAYKSNLDANHPLQLWAKRMTDAILGPDTTASAVAQTPADKWKRYTPLVLLGLAAWLLFSD